MRCTAFLGRKECWGVLQHNRGRENEQEYKSSSGFWKIL